MEAIQPRTGNLVSSQGGRVLLDDAQYVSELKPFMSIVAAVRESSTSLLIGADTGVHEASSSLKVSEPSKLKQHPSGPLAWGATGNITLGVEDFGSWATHYAWPPSDWSQFRHETATYLAKLNGEQRKLIKLAGKKPTPDDVARVLFAGWLDTPIIFALLGDGKQEVINSEDLYGIGSGWPVARVAYTALTQGARMKNPEAFVFSLYMTAKLHRYCDPPINAWRITPNGIENLLNEVNSAREKFL
jgi:hypothetical protein